MPDGIPKSKKLVDHGLSLAKLELYYPEPERLSNLLTSIGLENQVHVLQLANNQLVRLVAHINTRDGIRILQ